MISTSTDFIACARATVRKSRARVEITWTDPYIDATITASGSTENRVNYPSQVADLLEDMTYKWFHLDGHTPLSTVMHPMPGDITEATNYQVGWWSSAASDSSCNFSIPYPALTVEFPSRPITSLLVVGDNAFGEFPVDFDVELFSGTTSIYVVNIRGNILLRWAQDISEANVAACSKMVLTVRKWSEANRVIKISEFYTALLSSFSGDDIMSMNVIEEMEISNGSIPTGNISTSELDLSLNNIDKNYFAANPLSPIKSLLKPGRKIRAWLGFVLPDGSTDVSTGDYLVEDGVGYVPLGVFYSGDWDARELGVSASTTARDLMELLRKATFITCDLYINVTLKEIAEIVIEDAKINVMRNIQYYVDDELSSYSVPYAYFEKKNYMEILKQISIACMGRCYVNRLGTLVIVGPTALGVVG